MHNVIIYGASDDLIEVDGQAPGCGEYNTDHAVFVVTGTGGAATRIEVKYGDSGRWMIGIAPIDEDVEMVPAVVTQHTSGYSALAAFKDVQRVDWLAC